MSKVVVTGAGGRLGAGIARRLERQGRLLAGVDMVEGPFVSQVADVGKAVKFPRGTDAVIHCAALPGPSAMPPTRRQKTDIHEFIALENEDPVELLLKNLTSTARVFEAAAKGADVKKVIFSSSAFAMGWSHEAKLFRPAKVPLTEIDDATPLESYGLSKLLGESLGAMYSRASDIDVINLRFTNIIKREQFFSDMPWTYDNRLPLVMFAYCHEDDVVDAHLRALDLVARSETYLIAAPDTRFAEPTEELLDRHFDEKIETKSREKNFSVLDATKAMNELEWHPRSWNRGSQAAMKARKDPELRQFRLDDDDKKYPSGAVVTYRVYGEGPKLALIGTSYGAVHTELEYHIGTTIPMEYTVVVFNLMGNGISYSPSTNGSEMTFRSPTIAENVQAQHAALQADAQFRDRRIDLCYGYSMGAMQALEWARSFDVANVVAVCGASGCSDYNAVFVEALIACLTSDASRADKLRTFSAIYAGWGVGVDFYRSKNWQSHFSSLDDFLQNSYGAAFKDDDPDDLLAMANTWRATPRFSIPELQAITANVLLLPCDGDTYFRVDDLALHEGKHIPNATLHVLPSPHGHRAGDPSRPGMESELVFIQSHVHAFLADHS